MAARFAERASDGIKAMLDDSTAGINARCTAVNVDMAPVGRYALPTKWTVVQKKKNPRQLVFPCVIVSIGKRRIRGNEEYASNLWECEGFIRAGINAENIMGDPVVADTILQRFDRAMIEMFTERQTWDGTTLLNYACVNDARLGEAQWGELPAKKRSWWWECPVTVVVSEDNGPA